MQNSAVISQCGLFRYRLDRIVSAHGIVIAFFGVNAARADANVDDHTSTKWKVFTRQNGGCRYIAANPYAYRATDVNDLRNAADPIGPDNDYYLRQVIDEADLLVPCWGSRGKLPRMLRPRLDDVKQMILKSGKPVKIFGLTASNDPVHPLMIPYSRQLINWDG